MLTRAILAATTLVVALAFLTLGEPGHILPSFVLALVYVGCGWALLEVSNGGTLSLSATTLFYAIFIVYVAIPSVVSYAFQADPLGQTQWFAPGDKLLVSTAAGAVAFTLGVIVVAASNGTARLRKAITSHHRRPLVDDTSRGFWVAVVAVVGVALVLTIAFFYLNRHVYSELASASQIGRQRANIRAGQGYLVANFVYLLPWASYLGILVAVAARPRSLRRRLTMLATAAMVLLSFLAQAALLFRGNLVVFVLGFAVLAQAIEFRFSRRLLVVLGAIVALLLVTTATRLNPSQRGHPVQATLQKLESRFQTPMKQLAYVIDTRQQRHFAPGATYLMDIKALAPGHQTSFNGLIYKEMGNYGPGSATITIVGEGFANLGLLGVALELFVIGIVLQAATTWYLGGSKSVIRTFLYMLIALYGAKTVLGGVTQYALQPAVILLLVMAWVIYHRAVVHSLSRSRGRHPWAAR